MSTNSVLSALAVHPCTEIYLTKTAVQDGFVLCDFKSGHVFDLLE